MARIPMTKAQRIEASRHHATAARDAAAKLQRLLAVDDPAPAEVLKAAKVLEAAGCYIRRTVS